MASMDSVLMALEALQVLFPTWEQNEAVIRVYNVAWRRLSDQDLERGVDRFIDTYTTKNYIKQPSPADIIQAAGIGQGVTWDTAFDECVNKAYSLLYPEYVRGEAQPVIFSSPVVHEFCERFKNDILNVKQDNVGTLRAQFRQAWQNKEAQAGGLIKREQYKHLPEPQHYNMQQLQQSAAHFADRMVAQYGSEAKDDTELELLRMKSAKYYMEHKAHKLMKPALPEPEQQEQTPEQRRRALGIQKALIERHSQTPVNKLIPMIVRKLSGKRDLA